MNRDPFWPILALGVAVTCMGLVLGVIGRSFLDPSYRITVGEPSRLIAGMEIALIVYALCYFIFSILKD